MKGMPHFRQYPMGDVVNANLEPGEYVVRRNAVNALGVENMELLNHADGAHGALNKLMVSASLVNRQSQSNEPVKTEANGFPVADSPVRQRVDATRSMQEGGSVKDDIRWLKDPTQERVYHGMAPGDKELSRSTKIMPYDQLGQLRARSERLTKDYGGVLEAYDAVKAGKAPEGYNLQISEEDMYPSFKGELITGAEADSLWKASGFQEGGVAPYPEGSDWGEMNKAWLQSRESQPYPEGSDWGAMNREWLQKREAQPYPEGSDWGQMNREWLSRRGEEVPALLGDEGGELVKLLKSAGGYQEGGEVEEDYYGGTGSFKKLEKLLGRKKALKHVAKQQLMREDPKYGEPDEYFRHAMEGAKYGSGFGAGMGYGTSKELEQVGKRGGRGYITWPKSSGVAGAIYGGIGGAALGLGAKKASDWWKTRERIKELKKDGGYQGGGLLGMQYGDFGKKKGSPANGYQQGGVAENESPTFEKKSLKLLKQEMDRLKVEPEQKDAFVRNMYDWSRKVRSVESDNRPEAMADTSSAKGVYQFTDSSVVTGKNRMKRRGFDKKFIDAIPDDPRKWNNEQADAMFLSNMFSQEGSDKYLMGIGSGDIDAGKEAYYRFHHTKPDTATIRRVEERMAPKNNFQGGGEAGAKKDVDCVGGECDVPSAVSDEGYRTMPWQGKDITIDTMSRMEEDGAAQYLAEDAGGDYFFMDEGDIPADSLKAWALKSPEFSKIYSAGFQEGGPVEESDVNLQALQAQASLDSLQSMPTRQGPQAGYNMPSVNPRPDSYGGNNVGKDLSAIIPYMKSFGKIPTPIQEKERWLYQRLGVSPDSLPPQLRGLAGRALLQRYGNEQE